MADQKPSKKLENDIKKEIMNEVRIMFTDIQLVFKKLSKNVAMPYVKLLNKLIYSSNSNAEEKAIASDWQRIGDDLRKGIISYGRSKAK